VPVAFSELHELRSSIVGDSYQLKIRLPESYDTTTTTYPVLYLLDGDHAFAMGTDIVQYLIYGGSVPDLIVVSPAYGSKRTPDFGGTNMRNRDLLPFPFEGVPSTTAGAPRFLKFFEKELIPFVEGRFRVDGACRVLAGYSLGAIFVLYALFQKPDLFRTYIAIDGFDEQLWPIENAFAAKRRHLAAHVILSSRSGGSDLSGLASRLRERAYAGLTVEHRRLHRKGHFAVPADGLTRSLVAAFAT
jgi:hypothetical protein